MKTSALAAASLVLLLSPSRSDAQQMNLQIQDGRVTLDAQNVPVRQILAEWARVGGAKVVNGDKVVGAPVTLQLKGVPERQALDTILRGVSGYMLAARQAGTGVSSFDRILILPTSAAPRPNPPANAAFGGARPMPMPAQVAEPAETDVIEEDNDNDPPPEVDAEPEPEPDAEGGEEVVQPQPDMNQRFQRGRMFPNPMGGQVQPFVQPGQAGIPPAGTEGNEGVEGTIPGTVPGMVQPGPGAPFGVPAGATTTPGVVTPVPQQDQQQQQGQQRRPPRPPF